MGRVVPLQLVDHNLRAFVGAMCEYWEAHMGTWNVAMSHEMGRPCIYRWRQSSVKLADVRTRYRRRVEHHLSDSPLRPPKLQAILEQVAGWGRKAEEQIVKPTLRKPHLPLEVQIMIIDELYKVPHFNRNRVRDVRNLLRAFQWTLPDQYWISRCNLDLGFDIMGIPNMENVTDWGDFCTTLQYKLPGSTWWCTSGLALREAVLYRLKVVKEGFLKRVEGTNEDLDQQL
ncbi:hypothetical protein BJY01DRAFT_219435 [Aspergillus pseudoustus]|uniref:Uncharacterized protein n=1 Tax=Aspergillus pseudoustus TaxID=1810923 RepID=A0ABR4JGF2_9EURO